MGFILGNRKEWWKKYEKFLQIISVLYGGTALFEQYGYGVNNYPFGYFCYIAGGRNSFSFDVILEADAAFAGAEFALRPSADDVKIDIESGIQFLEDVAAYSTVKAERDGAVYFGFFSGSNQFPAKKYQVARVTYTYSGKEARHIRLIESAVLPQKTGRRSGEAGSSDANQGLSDKWKRRFAQGRVG